MGRPPGSLNKSTIEKMKAGLIPSKTGGIAPLGVFPTGVSLVDTRTDLEIVTDIEDRFVVLRDFLRGTDEITSLIASGSAGVGKSWTAEEILDSVRLKRPDFLFKIVKGTISAFDLYELAYNYRHAGNVIVLDDADRIFDDEPGLNILKSLLDTSAIRRVCWMTDHSRFKGDDAIPKEFEYNGSMVFLTNQDFQWYIDHGVGKHVDHMKAFMSRSIYLDLKMHTRKEVALWVSHVIGTNKVLQLQVGGITAAEEQMLLEWVMKNYENVRELSIRTVINLGKTFKRNKKDWEKTANILFIRKKV